MKALPVLVVIMIAGGAFFILSRSPEKVEETPQEKIVKNDYSSGEELSAGVPKEFVNEVMTGPKIDREWRFPEGIKLHMVSDDVGGSISRVHFIVKSPQKKEDVVIAQAQDTNHPLFIFRDSGKLKGGVFRFFVGPWENYNMKNNTADGVKVRATFKYEEILSGH